MPPKEVFILAIVGGTTIQKNGVLVRSYHGDLNPKCQGQRF